MAPSLSVQFVRPRTFQVLWADRSGATTKGGQSPSAIVGNVPNCYKGEQTVDQTASWGGHEPCTADGQSCSC